MRHKGKGKARWKDRRARGGGFEQNDQSRPDVLAALQAQREKAAQQAAAKTAEPKPAAKPKQLAGFLYDAATDRYFKKMDHGAPPYDRLIARKEAAERSKATDQAASARMAGILQLLRMRECGRSGPFFYYRDPRKPLQSSQPAKQATPPVPSNLGCAGEKKQPIMRIRVKLRCKRNEEEVFLF